MKYSFIEAIAKQQKIETSWAELGQAQPAAGLVKLLLAAFFNWSKISLEVYWIDVQLPLIKKANFIFSVLM